jgi:S-methylmethionine-dependent homocysteine/selenocysteine methylase
MYPIPRGWDFAQSCHGDEGIDDLGKFAELLAAEPIVVLDGAGGTELERRGYVDRLRMWSAGAIEDAPEMVVRIHRDYIEAGAQVITTQTFTCCRRRFRKVGTEVLFEPLTRRAVALAIRARREADRPDVLIAGSLSPLEHCYHPELAPRGDDGYAEHVESVRLLAEAGVDLLVIETMNTIDEARAALRAAKTSGLDVVLGFCCGRGGKLLSGESVRGAVEALDPLAPTAYAINCTPPSLTTRAVADLAAATSTPFGAYANVGDWSGGTWSRVFGSEFIFDVDPDAYLQHATGWRELGVAFVGGCCGTGPEHIRRLASAMARR